MQMRMRTKIQTLAAVAVVVAAVLPAVPSNAATNSRAERSSVAGEGSLYQIISERNIFDPNRRGPRPVGVPNPPPKIVDSFALTGTMNYPKGMFAFFDGNRPDYSQVLEAGGKVAGFTVQGIGHEVVQLAHDTNVVELKVGMQMVRADDGTWSASQATTMGFPSSGGNSRWESTGRMDRRDTGRNGFSRNNFSRGDFQGGFGSPMMQWNNRNGDSTGGLATEPGSGDPNDAVARMMMRRLQETGGGGGGVPPEGMNDGAPMQPESLRQGEPAQNGESPAPEPNQTENAPSNGNDNPNSSNED